MPDAMSMSPVEAVSFSRHVWERYRLSGDVGQARLHDVVFARRDHFFNDPIANPKIPGLAIPGYQTDWLNQVYQELLSRLCENPWRLNVKPAKDTEIQNLNAEQAEQGLENIIRLAERKQGIVIQRGLADGLIKDCYGIFHVRPMWTLYPHLPEAEYLEVLPEGVEAKRYQASRSKADKARGAYKEKMESRQGRRAIQGAKAGSPWIVECPDVTTVARLPDILGTAAIVRMRHVGLIDYQEDVKGRTASDPVYVSLNQQDGKIHVYMEQPAPGLAGARGYETTVGVMELWTRDECYEFVCQNPVSSNSLSLIEESWEQVDAWKTHWGEVPYWFAPAIEIEDPEPARRYKPALDGMYRLKPMYDLTMAMLMQLLAVASQNVYTLEHVATGMRQLDAKGMPMIITEASAAEMEIPEGYKLTRVNVPYPEAANSLAMLMRQEMEGAKPATGRAEGTSGQTQPWTLRQLLSQENIEPSHFLTNIDRAIEGAARFIAKVHSLPVGEGGFGGPLYVYGTNKEDGTVDPQTVIELTPEMLTSLFIEVNTNPTTAAEQIAKEEHGLSLWERRLPGLTREKLLEDYFGWPNPTQSVVTWEAEQTFLDEVYPGLRKRIVAEEYGRKVYVAPEGFVNAAGQQMTEDQVLASNGISRMQPRQPAGAPGGMQTQQQGSMPGLTALKAPGQTPQPGLPR